MSDQEHVVVVHKTLFRYGSAVEVCGGRGGQVLEPYLAIFINAETRMTLRHCQCLDANITRRCPALDVNTAPHAMQAHEPAKHDFIAGDREAFAVTAVRSNSNDVAECVS